MRIEKYLGEVMQKRQLKRDKELADWLGVSAAAISQYRSGARSMDNEKCVKVALELELDPLKVIMATDMDKAERSGQQSLWSVFSERMAATAATAIFAAGVTLFLTPQNAEARTYSLPSAQQSEQFILC
jgi:transcriptional regulator with XRE-family HTH domain